MATIMVAQFLSFYTFFGLLTQESDGKFTFSSIDVNGKIFREFMSINLPNSSELIPLIQGNFKCATI